MVEPAVVAACQGSWSLHSQVIPAQCPVKQVPQQLVRRAITGNLRAFVLNTLGSFSLNSSCSTDWPYCTRTCCPWHPGHAIPHTLDSPDTLSLTHWRNRVFSTFVFPCISSSIFWSCIGINKNTEPIMYGRSSLYMTTQVKHGFFHQS